jgi:hypothetical protein
MIIIGVTLFLASCSKSSSTPTPLPATGEMPFQAAVHNAALINGKEAYGQSGGAEIGYRVHFTTGGTVTKLGANMATTGTYVVSFWRTSDSTLLGRVSVNNSDTSKFAYASVSPINVIVDTGYTISINIPNGAAQEHWVYTWSPFRDLYPFTEGHVVADQALDQAYLPLNTPPTYPYDVYSSDQGYIGSSCDFVFLLGK